MSWHVLVATHFPPATSTLEGWALDHPELQLDGAIDGVHRTAILRRRAQGEEPARVAAMIYAPEPAEESTLPQMVADAVLSPRFRLRIAVPGASALDRRVAISLAAAIARESQGAVFDPQAEEILEPESLRRISRKFAVRCPVPPTPEGEVEIVDARGQKVLLRDERGVFACRIVRIIEDDDGREIVLVDTGHATIEVTRDQLVEC